MNFFVAFLAFFGCAFVSYMILWLLVRVWVIGMARQNNTDFCVVCHRQIRVCDSDFFVFASCRNHLVHVRCERMLRDRQCPEIVCQQNGVGANAADSTDGPPVLGLLGSAETLATSSDEMSADMESLGVPCENLDAVGLEVYRV